MKIFEYSHILRIKHVRFLTSSVLVTSSDYIVFFLLLQTLGPALSNVISYCIAICLSFNIQKKFVFDVGRKAPLAFSFVILFSLMGIFLSTWFLVFLNHLFSSVVVAKVLMTFAMFFYNFYTKKIAFGDKE